MKKIGIIVGSLRAGSFNKMVALYLQSQLSGYDTHMIDISAVDMYNVDLDGNPPESWQFLRNKIAEMDAFLFVSPEYNRSMPAALKNALDVASRPYGHNKWGGKPGAVVTASPSGIGGFGANHHIRQVLSYLNVYTMQQPEAYVGGIDSAVNEKGEIVNEGTKKFLNKIAADFSAWIEHF